MEEKARDNYKDATPILRVQSQNQAGVKVDVKAGHQNVEYQQLQGWSNNVRNFVIDPV